MINYTDAAVRVLYTYTRYATMKVIATLIMEYMIGNSCSD